MANTIRRSANLRNVCMNLKLFISEVKVKVERYECTQLTRVSTKYYETLSDPSEELLYFRGHVT